MSTPIYYVIVEDKTIPPTMCQVWVILKVFACDLDDTSQLYLREILPLIRDGRNAHSLLFHREPPNMFREQAIEKSVWDI